MLIILDGWPQILFLILMMAVALKALIGFHWPWEKCECCGKKFREHKKTGSLLLKPECKPIDWEAEKVKMNQEREREFVDRPFKEGYLPPPEGPLPKTPSLPPKPIKKKNRMDGCV